MAVGICRRNTRQAAPSAWRRTLAALLFAAAAAHIAPAIAADNAEQVPLIEAEKAPTRIRPAAPAVAAPIAAPAMSLPVRGIPQMSKMVPPSDGRVIELAAMTPSAPHLAHTTIRSKAFKLQLASAKTAAGATREAAKLRHRYAAELGDATLSVERGPRGAWYRVVSQPMPSQAEARGLCDVVTAAHGSCLVVATHVRPERPGPAGETLVAAHKPAKRGLAKGKPVRAQLASLRSFHGAARELDRLSRRYANVLDRTQLAISRIDQGDRGVFYRVVTAPLPNRSAASGLCHRISPQAGCILIPERQRNAEITGPPGSAAEPV